MLLKRTIFFAVNEIKKLKKQPLILLITIVLPVLAILVLILTFQKSTIKEIPTSIVDYDNTALSRMVTRHLDATLAVNVVNPNENEEKAKEKLIKTEIYQYLIIPKDFEKNINCGSSSMITIVSNGAAILYSKISYRSIATTLSMLSTGIQIRRLEAKGLTEKEAQVRAAPVRAAISTPGNPWLDYGIYMLPGMAFAILQMAASFSTIWLFREHRESSAGRIIPPKHQKIPFFLGKLIPIFTFNIIGLTISLILLISLSFASLNGIIFYLLLNSIILIIVSMGLGAFLSISLTNLVTAMQINLLINAPSFVFSGYTFPRWAMPGWIEAISNVIPITHFLDGFFPLYIFKIFSTNGLVSLCLIGIILWSLTLLQMNDKVNNFRLRYLKFL